MTEYLVSYGSGGSFGRFRPASASAFRRGDRVVVRSDRGLELGVVLCEATEGHVRQMPDGPPGELLRAAAAEDERAAERQRERGARIHDEAVRRAGESELPLEVLDVEVPLDGSFAVLHQVRWGDCDVRPFVSALSRQFDVQVILFEVGQQPAEEHGCGRPGCGKTAGGGCSTCGTGGGCSSCGAGHTAGDVETYFAGLREQMERRRTALL